MAQPKPYNILLAEDDGDLASLLVENFILYQYSVIQVYTGKDALFQLSNQQFDICILDIMMPELDGFSVASVIRMRYPFLPFLFLTARKEDRDKFHGFDIGADDYVTKPFSFQELHYRILAILKRYNDKKTINNDELSIGSIRLNIAKQYLQINNFEQKVNYRECKILAMLISGRGQFVNTNDILTSIWGSVTIYNAASLNVYISRIRRLLQADPRLEIENTYGTGFRLIQK